MIAADSTGIIQAVVVAVLGGGLFAGIYALLKIRPEAGQISVTAAQGAVIVQTGVIETLRQENEGLRGELHNLHQENEELHLRVRSLERENVQLQDRVGMLELQLQGLEEGTTDSI